MKEEIKIKMKYFAKMAPIYIVVIAALAMEAAARVHDFINYK
jgi:hypothetical protein